MLKPKDILALEALGLGGDGGGSSVTVEPLTVTQNGTTTAPSGKAYSPVTVAVPNPNSVVTVTGTAAEPFGSIDPAELHTAITSNNATALIDVDASAIGVLDTLHLFATPASTLSIAFQAVSYVDASYTTCAAMNYNKTTGALVAISALMQGDFSVLTDYAAMLTTTLTVIYHPLTGSLEAAENETFGTVSGGED